ncbi:MAG: HEAT repeat domain-containing protein [Polyangiaceae bacterium]|jgi:HEAT repeat protein
MGHASSHSIAVAAFLAGILGARGAFADLHAAAPADGGLAALDVRVDLAGAIVDSNGTAVPIDLDRARLPTEEAVSIETISIGQHKHVIHVRVPTRGAGRDGPAWEAILAAGRPRPLWAGVTGLTEGDPGERTGKAIQIVAFGPTAYVLVGDIHEDNRICGQSATLIDPQALYPATLEFKSATVHRLSAEQRAASESIDARPIAGPLPPPLSKLLVARSSSVAGSRGLELVDGDAQTVWRELRPGAGQGEFVVLAAPKDVPIPRLAIVLLPPNPRVFDSGAAPKTLFVVTNTQTFRIAIPEDASTKPGQAYEVDFPKPVETSCLSLVLDEAYARGLAHPDVGVAELVAYSEFDVQGDTLDQVANRLSSDSGVAAAETLERAGPKSLAAVSRAYEGLDAHGRALAMDVAASVEPCQDAAPLLTRAVCDDAGEASRKAREKLERCVGVAVALASRMREDTKSRACVASLFATIAPGDALEPIANALAATSEADRESRAALRAAFGEALGRVPPGRFAPLLGDPGRSLAARLELMRAADFRVTEAAREVDATVTELLSTAPTLRNRYLALGPLGWLARAGDAAAAARIVDALAHDAEWPVRVHAAEEAAGVSLAHVELIRAVHDPEPRVREAVLAALVVSPSPDTVEPAIDRLVHDDWWFVKTQAVNVLVTATAKSSADDALGLGLRDPSPRVRRSIVVALASRHAVAWRDAIRDLLADKDEDNDVRAAAATALGALCDVDSTGRLTDLIRGLSVSGNDSNAEQLGLGALLGLSALHPPNLAARLAPLLANSSPPGVRAAAQQALLAKPLCR